MEKGSARPEVIAIAALGKRTRYICHDDQLLWRIPADLQRVKSLTLGHPIIMGRKTFTSIGKALPGRTNIILTRDKDFKSSEDIHVFHTLEDALAFAESKDREKVFIFGGGEIYNLALNQTDTLMLTLVDSDDFGTAQFPKYESAFELSGQEETGGVYEGHTFTWATYKRKA